MAVKSFGSVNDFGKAKVISRVYSLKRLVIGLVCFIAIGCSPIEQAPIQSPAQSPAPIAEPDAHSSFTMRNSEIRQDILTAMTQQGIEHWLNADGSVGFYAADTEVVDAIGFNAIGAYAARN